MINQKTRLINNLHNLSSLTKLFIISIFFAVITILPTFIPSLKFNNHNFLRIVISITLATNVITEAAIFFLKRKEKNSDYILSFQIIINTILLVIFLHFFDRINGPLFIIFGLTLMESFLNLNLILPVINVCIMASATLIE